MSRYKLVIKSGDLNILFLEFYDMPMLIMLLPALFFFFIQITKIENVNHLCDLRVLNLARNLLSHVDNLNGLDSLTELNLRHNQITFVVSTTVTTDAPRFSLEEVMIVQHRVCNAGI